MLVTGLGNIHVQRDGEEVTLSFEGGPFVFNFPALLAVELGRALTNTGQQILSEQAQEIVRRSL